MRGAGGGQAAFARIPETTLQRDWKSSEHASAANEVSDSGSGRQGEVRIQRLLGSFFMSFLMFGNVFSILTHLLPMLRLRSFFECFFISFWSVLESVLDAFGCI